MKTLSCLLALLMLCAVALGARAQEVPTGDYLLGADDVLEITVHNHMDLDRTLSILPDGKIAFPEVGELQAAGKTPRALAAEIQAVLEKTRNKVEVVVSVREIKSRKARVVGGVKSSGSYDIRRGFRLMDLLALAGGLNARPTRVTGRLIRADGKVIQLDLVKATAQPGSEANLLLEPNDLALLDEMETSKQVHVLGQVAKPGAFDLSETTTLMSMISEAGGPTEKAALSKAYIMRGADKIPFNLVPILLKGQEDDSVTGFKLRPGDVLMLPEIELKYAVLGQVTKPGYYPIQEKGDMTILEALSFAGGQTVESDLRNAGLFRSVGGKSSAVKVNLEEILRKGKLDANLKMQAGDVLFIPSRNKRPFGLQDVLSPLSFLFGTFLR